MPIINNQISSTLLLQVSTEYEEPTDGKIKSISHQVLFSIFEHAYCICGNFKMEISGTNNRC